MISWKNHLVKGLECLYTACIKGYEDLPESQTNILVPLAAQRINCNFTRSQDDDIISRSEVPNKFYR